MSSLSRTIDTRISVAVDEWFSCLQMMLTNAILLILSSFAWPCITVKPTCADPSLLDSAYHPIYATLFFIRDLYCSPCPNSCQTNSSLMEVCFDIRLDEDRTNATSILTTPTVNSTTFNCWKLHGRPIGDKKHPPNNKQSIDQAYVSESTGHSQPPDPHGKQTDPN
ncbi:uncharacterized protein E5676_scaffold418G00100 [Cucumis melo var. makuwa]|uniref:Uncharacterized protein n=1 Tax=Cucumis melo var. makuwa TaxID=1194695 RepID=A0A5D3D5T8_CUCMM|nr:uncharacterized protein E6C27_scaffold284G00770 [Cucumis melo var. makuwa]TYK18928.1 uncharacterized protein E5676_scaffold418G00100 [Cucumis melo var. makuwa]